MQASVKGELRRNAGPRAPSAPSAPSAQPHLPIKWFSSEWEGAIAGKGLPTVPGAGCCYHNLFPCWVSFLKVENSIYIKSKEKLESGQAQLCQAETKAILYVSSQLLCTHTVDCYFQGSRCFKSRRWGSCPLTLQPGAWLRVARGE